MHHITPFWDEKLKNFLWRGTAPPQTLPHSPPTAPLFSRLRRSTCDPAKVPVALTRMLNWVNSEWSIIRHQARQETVFDTGQDQPEANVRVSETYMDSGSLDSGAYDRKKESISSKLTQEATAVCLFDKLRTFLTRNIGLHSRVLAQQINGAKTIAKNCRRSSIWVKAIAFYHTHTAVLRRCRANWQLVTSRWKPTTTATMQSIHTGCLSSYSFNTHLWPWAMILTFNLWRAMVGPMTHTRAVSL